MRKIKWITAVLGIIAPVLFFAAEVGMYYSEKNMNISWLLVLVNCFAVAELIFAVVQIERIRSNDTMFLPVVYSVLTAFCLWLGCGFGWTVIKMLRHLPPYGFKN